jgi:hypothetical protein
MEFPAAEDLRVVIALAEETSVVIGTTASDEQSNGRIYDENSLHIAGLQPDGNLAWKNLLSVGKHGTFSFPPRVFDLAIWPDGRLLVVGEVKSGYPESYAACLDPIGRPQTSN